MREAAAARETVKEAFDVDYNDRGNSNRSYGESSLGYAAATASASSARRQASRAAAEQPVLQNHPFARCRND
jgi:hypothetical protein